MDKLDMNYEWNESDDRVRVVIPLRINIVLISLYSLALVIWITMIGIVASYLVSGRSNGIVLTVLLIIWIIVWLWFGRFLWGRWQHQAAKREILFIDQQQVILRRPVSILGQTTAYSFEHISPFYFSDKHKCPAFDYAYLHVYFGQNLEATEANELVGMLNERFFPDVLGEF